MGRLMGQSNMDRSINEPVLTCHVHIDALGGSWPLAIDGHANIRAWEDTTISTHATTHPIILPILSREMRDIFK